MRKAAARDVGVTEAGVFYGLAGEVELAISDRPSPDRGYPRVGRLTLERAGETQRDAQSERWEVP